MRSLALAAVALAVMFAISIAVAQGRVVATVGGGGTGVFDVPSNPCFGAVTKFAVSGVVHTDGSASGHFECVVTGGKAAGGLYLSATITSGTINGDGSVTLSGPGLFHQLGTPSFPVNYTVTVTAGGPGVGGFCLLGETSCVPPPGCDHEVLVDGNISIK